MNWSAVGTLIGIAGIAFGAGTYVTNSDNSVTGIASKQDLLARKVADLEQMIPAGTDLNILIKDINFANKEIKALKTGRKNLGTFRGANHETKRVIDHNKHVASCDSGEYVSGMRVENIHGETDKLAQWATWKIAFFCTPLNPTN